jgi:hypothetical protein
MDTSTQSLLILASGAARLGGDGKGPLLAGAAQAVPAAFLLTASPPLTCLLAVCRSPRPRPSRAGCQHQTTAVKAGQVVGGSGVGPLALALTAVVDLACPRGRELLPRRGA